MTGNSRLHKISKIVIFQSIGWTNVPSDGVTIPSSYTPNGTSYSIILLNIDNSRRLPGLFEANGNDSKFYLYETYPTKITASFIGICAWATS